VINARLPAVSQGSVVFTPCAGVADTCLGDATLTLSIGNPRATVASQTFTLVYPVQVGEVTQCQTDHNVMHLHGNDSIEDGTYESPVDVPWLVEPALDQVAFDLDDPATNGGGAIENHFVGTFSLLPLQEPLTPGIYEHAVRESTATAGQPGIDVNGRSYGCNIIAGRFEVYDYTQNPVDGSVESATISFEQACDPEPDFTGNPTVTLTVGCFHYQVAAP